MTQQRLMETRNMRLLSRFSLPSAGLYLPLRLGLPEAEAVSPLRLRLPEAELCLLSE